MFTLGINAVFHDSSACLIKDGIVVAAAEEERFTQIKHGKRPVPFSTYELPFHAIDFCLRQAGIALKDVDHFAYSYDPDITPETSSPFAAEWDPLFLRYVRQAPRFLIDGVPHHLEKRWRGAQRPGADRWHFVEHHTAHAASAFHVSPFREAAVLTLDGRGESATTTINLGEGNDLTRLSEVHMPHSLGMLYEQVTAHLGFLHSSDEYKVMALASYGRPAYVDEFHSMIRLTGDGRYRIEEPRLTERFGAARRRGDPFEGRHFDIAHSLQKVLEETVIELARYARQTTKKDALCLAGGVALNCVMNARIRDAKIFRDIWVQPAAGDAGTSLGAAVWIDTKERKPSERTFVMDQAYLGPSYADSEIEAFLKEARLPYRKLDRPADEVAELLEDGCVIGWFQGRMEFGPRALGARSILASPLEASMQQRLNQIKDREDFRPVAPVVLEEEAATWFINGGVSPFMLLVFDVKPDKAARIPAVTHVDGTARIQTVSRHQNERYYDLLKAFQKRTGVPILINTSFNTRGKPVVCTPRDAVECFFSTPLDSLVMGSFLLEKNPTAAFKESVSLAEAETMP